MSYEPTIWKKGDKVTSTKLNKIENGIQGNDEEITSIKENLTDKAPVITDTASGAIASFTDGADGLPLKSLVVNINPVQDLHGQDAPYPAGGGVNLLDPAKCSTIGPGGTYGLTVTHDQATAIWTISGTPTSQNASLAFNFCTYSDFSLSGKGYQVQAFPISGTPIKNIYGFRNETESRIAIIIDTVANPTVNVTFKVSVAATAQTAWSPYSNICPISGYSEAKVYVSPTQDAQDATVYTIDLDGARYGGTLDVTTGKLTVDRAMVDLGAKNWYPSTSAGRTRFRTSITDIERISSPNVRASLLCSNYPTKTANQTYQGTTGVSLQQNEADIYIYDPQMESMTGGEFKSAMSGVQLCYELATPQTYQLTPTEVTTLLGDNTIWADTGDTEVEYRTDPDLYIQRKMPEVPVDDVQINGTSIVSDGVANVPVDTSLTIAGAAADAKKTGDEIGDLKEDLSDAFIESKNLFDKSATVPNNVLDIGSGTNINSMHSSSLYCVSNIIPVEAGQYVCNSLFADTTIRLNVYGADGGYLGGVYGTAQTDGSYIFNVIGVAVKQGRFSYKPTTLDADTFMFVKGNALPSEYEPYGTRLNPAYVERQIQTAVDSYEIPDGSVTPTKTSFAVHDPDTNLIDTSKCALGYINGAIDGIVKASTTFYCTDFIQLKEDTDYYYNSNYLYGGYCAFYDEDKVYISGYGQTSAESRLPNPFVIPDNAVYGRFTITSESRLANAWICESNQMAEKPKPYAEEIKTKFVEERPTDYKGNEISVFTKILCIGDSLTDGFFNESGGSRLIMRNRAYPAKLQALTGVECVNMGYAGYTSIQWYDAYQNEDLSGYDACIIQLGVNDGLQNVSVADMTTAFNNIITKVKNENANIKIFVATIIPANGYMTNTMQTYAGYIRTIVNDLNDSNVYLVDMWQYGHTDDYLAYDAGHLSALGYLRLAEDYKAYIGYIIRNNASDFRYVQFAGTAYTYAGDSTVRSLMYS